MQQSGSDSHVIGTDDRLERVGNATDGHDGSCILVGFVHYQPCLGPTSGRQAARKPCVVRCCYWKGLAEVRFPGWQVVNCLISTTVANDIPFGNIVYQYLCAYLLSRTGLEGRSRLIRRRPKPSPQALQLSFALKS